MLNFDPLEIRNEEGLPTGKYRMVAYPSDGGDNPECIDCCDHYHDSHRQALECNDAILVMRRLQAVGRSGLDTGGLNNNSLITNIAEEDMLALAIDRLGMMSHGFGQASEAMENGKLLKPDGSKFTTLDIAQQKYNQKALLVACFLLDQELGSLVEKRNAEAAANLAKAGTAIVASA